MSNGGATPIFRVADLRASIDYYVNALGFKCDWGDEWFASVSRDRCHLLLCNNDQGHAGAWTWIGVNDAEAFAAELRGRGVKIAAAIEEHAPGIRRRIIGGRTRCRWKIPTATCCDSDRTQEIMCHTASSWI
jgi:hypothetical protein